MVCSTRNTVDGNNLKSRRLKYTVLFVASKIRNNLKQEVGEFLASVFHHVRGNRKTFAVITQHNS